MAPVVFLTPKYAPFVVSLGLIYFGYSQVKAYKELKNWISVPGCLLQTEVGFYTVHESQYGAPTKYYFPMAYYSYSYQDNVYKNNEYAFDAKSVSSAEKQEIENVLANLSKQELIDVYLDPANPHESAIDISIGKKRQSHAYGLCVASFIIFLSGVFLIGIL